MSDYNDPRDFVERMEGEPAWLTAIVDQVFARFDEAGAFAYADKIKADVVMATATEPDDNTPAARERWERQCDNCGSYTPRGDEPFHTGTIYRMYKGQRVCITFGMCTDCKDRTVTPG